MKIALPKKPRIRLKEQPLDQRSVTVCPIRAATDRTITPMQLRALLVYCSYTNKAGVAWVGLERIGKDLGVSTARAHQLIKALTSKGYIVTLHKGYTGICANTRRVMFNPEISAADAATISGDLAPYQFRQQQDEQRKERIAMDKRQAKRRTKKPVVIRETYQAINSDRVYVSGDKVSTDKLVDLQLITQQVFSHVGADILQLALDSVGSDATHAQIEAAIDKLMR